MGCVSTGASANDFVNIFSRLVGAHRPVLHGETSDRFIAHCLQNMANIDLHIVDYTCSVCPGEANLLKSIVHTAKYIGCIWKPGQQTPMTLCGATKRTQDPMAILEKFDRSDPLLGTDKEVALRMKFSTLRKERQCDRTTPRAARRSSGQRETQPMAEDVKPIHCASPANGANDIDGVDVVDENGDLGGCFFCPHSSVNELELKGFVLSV